MSCYDCVFVKMSLKDSISGLPQQALIQCCYFEPFQLVAMYKEENMGVVRYPEEDCSNRISVRRWKRYCDKVKSDPETYGKGIDIDESIRLFRKENRDEMS